MKIRFLVLALLAIMLATFAFACGDDDGGDDADSTTPPASTTDGSTPTPKPFDKVVFMAGFKPQANLPFVGAYVAEDKGFFADEGLSVDIRHVVTPGDNFRFMATGEVQISTADASSLLEKWTGDPVLEIVSFALIGQTGQQGFAVLEDSGIETPADWTGKIAGYKGSAVTPDYLAVLEANDVDRSSVEEVRVGFEPQILTEGAVDIFPVFLSNEPDTLERLGYPTKVFTAAEYGASTLGLTYVTTADYAAENPEIVERFRRAVLRGIEYADENRDEAIDIVMQYAPQEDPVHQRFMLDTELDMAKTGDVYEEGGIGAQTEEQWQALHDYMIEHGGLPRPIDDISKVFIPAATSIQ